MRALRLLGFLLCFVFGAYGWFLGRIPVAVAEPERATDGIVVLTGGALRLDEAAAVMAKGLAGRLLVSGVSTDSGPEDIRARLAALPDAMFNCCVDLGYQARNTIGNADEAAAWARAHGMATLRVVTAAYHMPRALAELNRALPEVVLLPHPVFPERSFDSGTLPAVTAPLEFAKYTAALVRQRLAEIAPETAGTVEAPIAEGTAPASPRTEQLSPAEAGGAPPKDTP
ncbi:YdcF family protein [Zavarzinia compransoris]|uniref:YdcF family protein n=1 Tax=Zavarzinia marina TaxID=2911065 RepID=UPI001F39E965|nr:YdcF family protein [Zavarzinia marina]MCF4166731.1 YdcF family protein [Zavarzinia marina]